MAQRARSLAATFPLTARIDLGHGVHEVDIVRERDGGYVASVEDSEQRFEIDELGRDTIRFRADGLTESAKFLRDGDRLYFLHRGVTIAVRDLTLAAPASRRGERRRRQGARGDERPRGGGAGQAGRAGHGSASR